MPAPATREQPRFGPASVFAFFALVGSISLQAGAAQPVRFGSVNLRPSGKESGPASSALFGPRGSFYARNATLQRLAATAYGVQSFQVAGGPDWVRSERFDIDAAATDPAASPEQMRRMVQQLLAEHFQLVVIRSSRLTDVFSLHSTQTVRHPGGRLRSSSACAGGSGKTERCGIRGYGGHLSGTGITMEQFAAALSTHATRVVVDRTALPGRFNLELEYMPAFGALPASDQPADQRAPGTGPTLNRALNEQLGLTLVAGVESVSSLWIEAVDRPVGELTRAVSDRR